jgi:hypothetical protein
VARWARAGARVGVLVAAGLGIVLLGFAVQPQTVRRAAAGLSVSVSGNHLVDGSGRPLQLRGVNRSGTEYACIQGWGIFDGPSDQASVAAIAAWHADVVRVPLNEDCWLSINGASANFSGAAYQQAIVNYVNLLHANGLYAVLDLHWSAAGTAKATGQQPMPDRDHSPAFWSSVATTFKGDPAALFDLYNEPYPDSNADTTAAWTCWRDGGSCSGVGFTAAGFQELVNTVRGTGASNVIMLGGVEYANAMGGWLSHRPTDAAGQLAASWHSYPFNICNTQSCWDSKVAPITAQYPVITGETGDSPCKGTPPYVSALLPWADSHAISYLGWTWDTWGACSDNVLIQDYQGTPTSGYGQYFHDHLAAVSGTPTPTPTPVLSVPPLPLPSLPLRGSNSWLAQPPPPVRWFPREAGPRPAARQIQLG